MEHIQNLHAKLDMIDEKMGEGYVDRDPAFAPLRTLSTNLPTERKGTMKAWFAGRTMTEVDTLQITKTGKPWHPGPRMVEVRSTMVLLDGSMREYRGCKVIAASDDTLVVHNASGFDTVIIYRAVPRP